MPSKSPYRRCAHPVSVPHFPSLYVPSWTRMWIDSWRLDHPVLVPTVSVHPYASSTRAWCLQQLYQLFRYIFLLECRIVLAITTDMGIFVYGDLESFSKRVFKTNFQLGAWWFAVLCRNKTFCSYLVKWIAGNPMFIGKLPIYVSHNTGRLDFWHPNLYRSLLDRLLPFGRILCHLPRYILRKTPF